MSYIRKFNYEIIPEDSYAIIRGCSGCNCKSIYKNTNHFRMNSNGNRLDVWMIYQCEVCKHTYNLTIYERVKTEMISSEEYRLFMENDALLALKYGTDKTVFAKNKAEIDNSKMNYHLLSVNEQTGKLNPIVFQTGDLIEIENISEIKLRWDKLAAEILHISRNKLKMLETNEKIKIISEISNQKIEIWIQEDIYK